MQYPDSNLPIGTQMFDACTALMDDCVRNLIESRGSLSLDKPRRHGRTLLTHSAAIASVCTMKLLLDNGADPNLVDDDNDSPLECAVWSERDELVSLLLLHGADPDKGGKGMKYLLEIAETRAPDCLEVLRVFVAEREAERAAEILHSNTPEAAMKRGSHRL